MVFAYFTQVEAQTLFDIAKCRCSNFRQCECSDEKKVPLSEQRFLIDQRNARKMSLKRNPLLLQSNQSFNSSEVENDSNDSNISISTQKEFKSSSQSDENSNYVSANQIRAINLRSRPIAFSDDNANSKRYNTLKLVEVAKVADRCNVSSRVAAQIATAALVDAGQISQNNKILVIDRMKVDRSRRRERENQLNSLLFEGIQGIYFDGRHDETIESRNGKIVTRKEDHISFVQQPESLYIGHKTVPNGTAHAIVTAMLQLMKEKSIQIDDINIIGCDGTPVNTGCDGGAIRLFEKHWQKAVQWVVCMAHMVELQVRALIEKLDGPYKSKDTLSGPIGRKLNGCEALSIANFEPIDFPCNAVKESLNLSSDQKYLFDICTSISAGNVSHRLAARTIGPMSKARWVTTACRILRVYIAEENPSQILCILAQYVMLVYAPTLY